MYPKPTFGPGLCECGCGRPASRRFVKGHSAKKGPAAFWARVPDHLPADECWPWPGPFHPTGYGTWGGRKVHQLMAPPRAHAGLVVRHTCDNPPCCNPEHLIIGTHADNVRDMVDRGRVSRPGAKITAVDARRIRERYAVGDIYQRELAEEYGLAQSQIHRILHSQRWKEAA